jgi:hypothetical protein
MKLIHRWIIVILAIASLLLSACAPASSTQDKVQPSKIEPIEGSDLKRVILTEKAAERLDIQTVLVRDEQAMRTRTVGGEVVANQAPPIGEESTAGSGDASTAGAVWVRVSLSESDRSRVDLGQPARIRSLDDEDGVESLTAEAGESPDFVDLQTEDADADQMFYMVNGPEHGLVAGQRVFVEYSLLRSGRKHIVIPYAAVIYDVQGETWVYTNPETLVYVRFPILVDFIEGGLAFLLVGPPSGTLVVTVGVSELYGAETGVSK